MEADHFVRPLSCMLLVANTRCPLMVCLALSGDNRCCDRSTSMASFSCAWVVRQGCQGRVARWVSMPSEASRLPAYCRPLTSWWCSLVMVARTTCLVACRNACSCWRRVGLLAAAILSCRRGSSCPARRYSAYNSSHVTPPLC